jgi:hypothetical protein
LELETIFYCLRFETSRFVASYDSQGHGGGIRPRLHKWIQATTGLRYIGPSRTTQKTQFYCCLAQTNNSRDSYLASSLAL